MIAISEMDYGRLSVIVPTMNECRNISRLLRELGRYKGMRIIVADDGSTDGTRNSVLRQGKTDKRILLIDRSHKKVHGLAISVLDAVPKVSTRYLVVMDGDMQHPPELVKEVYSKLTGGFDMVVCTRKKIERWGFHRRVISRAINAVALIVFRLRGRKTVKDMMSGFFGIRTELFKATIRKNKGRFVPEGYKVMLDLLRMVGHETQICELPYNTFHERAYGKSKFRPKHMLNTLRSIFRY